MASCITAAAEVGGTDTGTHGRDGREKMGNVPAKWLPKLTRPYFAVLNP